MMSNYAREAHQTRIEKMTFKNRIVGRLWLIPLATAVILACDAGRFVSPPEEESATLRLYAAVASDVVTGLSVEIDAYDIEPPLVFNIPISEGVATGSVRVTAGSDRRFTLHAFDAHGVETHRGSDTVEIVAGENPPLEITMHPLQGDQEIVATIGSFIVVVSPAADTVLAGETTQLSAEVIDSLGETLSGATVHWVTLDPEVATVDSQGLVHGVAPGSASVVATYGSVGGSSSIVVREATVSDDEVPSVPMDLSATAVSSSRIELGWSASSDNVGVAGYYVYRSGSEVADVSSTGYSDTGLTASTTYSYTVAAYDAAGNVSGESASASATTDEMGVSPAELPRAVVDFTMPTASTTLTVKSSGGDFTTVQAAWDAISAAGRTANTEIVIDAGYDPGSINTGAQSGDDTYWVVIRSANSGSLPRHVRVGPSDKANMPQITVPAGGPALNVEANTKRVRFVGISTETGPSSYPTYHAQLDRTARYIIIDRCLADGGYGDGQQSRIGYGLHGQHIGLIDSYVYDINADLYESKGLLTIYGAGPFTFVNNFIEGGAIGVLFGGSNPGSSEEMPRDITFVRNYIFRNPAWASDSNVAVKNLFEIKHGERFLVEHNALENSWAKAQSYAVNLKSVDPNEVGYAQHVTFRYNTVENYDDGITLAAQPTNQNTGTGAPLPLWYVSIHDNEFLNGGRDNPHNQQSSTRAVAMYDDLAYLTFKNNDFRGEFNNQVNFDGDGKTDLVFEDNIIGIANYGFQNSDSLDDLAPGHSVTGNILDPATWNTPLEGNNCITWPPPDENCSNAGVQTPRHSSTKSGDFSADPWNR